MIVIKIRITLPAQDEPGTRSTNLGSPDQPTQMSACWNNRVVGSMLPDDLQDLDVAEQVHAARGH